MFCINKKLFIALSLIIVFFAIVFVAFKINQTNFSNQSKAATTNCGGIQCSTNFQICLNLNNRPTCVSNLDVYAASCNYNETTLTKILADGTKTTTDCTKVYGGGVCVNGADNGYILTSQKADCRASCNPSKFDCENKYTGASSINSIPACVNGMMRQWTCVNTNSKHNYYHCRLENELQCDNFTCNSSKTSCRTMTPVNAYLFNLWDTHYQNYGFYVFLDLNNVGLVINCKNYFIADYFNAICGEIAPEYLHEAQDIFVAPIISQVKEVFDNLYANKIKTYRSINTFGIITPLSSLKEININTVNNILNVLRLIDNYQIVRKTDIPSFFNQMFTSHNVN